MDKTVFNLYLYKIILSTAGRYLVRIVSGSKGIENSSI